MATRLAVRELFEPIGNIISAEVIINPGDGNLKVDGSVDNVDELASGSLQFIEKFSPPTWIVTNHLGKTTLTVETQAKRQPWHRLPWAACNGATEWHISINPRVFSGINTHSDGGNITLDLIGMPVTQVYADTGGGNVEISLPIPISDLLVDAASGAGNVIIHLPCDVAASIIAKTGLGKAIIASRFVEVGKNTYQTDGYEYADKKVLITITSGAGNVIVEEIQ
jgi:hypothetical protein